MTGFEPLRLGVVGMSHLGLTVGVCAGWLGYSVICCDTNVEKIQMLRGGRLPMYERGLEEKYEEGKAHLHFVDNLEELKQCAVVIFALDTPTDEGNRSNLSLLQSWILDAAPNLSVGTTLVVMSQVPSGFMNALRHKLSALRPDLAEKLYYWVETLGFGDAVRNFIEPERIIVGSASAREPDGAFGIFLKRFRCPIFVMRYESAELVKEAISLYRAFSMSFAHFMSEICERAGGSMRELIPALRSDRRIGEHAQIDPSLGVAGGNIERDLVQLRETARALQVDAQLLDSILSSNTKGYEWLMRQVREVCNAIEPGGKIGFLGIAYKKNTESTRNSFALRALEEIETSALVYAYDPHATLPEELHGKVRVAPLDEVIREADALVVMTDWEHFERMPLEGVARLMRGNVIIDCWGLIDPRAARDAGLVVRTMGEGRTAEQQMFGEASPPIPDLSLIPTPGEPPIFT